MKLISNFYRFLIKRNNERIFFPQYRRCNYRDSAAIALLAKVYLVTKIKIYATYKRSLARI